MAVLVESLVFGAVSSVHCAGMCGPLAACFSGDRASVAGYHAGRTGAYLLAGAVAGASGGLLGARSLPSAWVAFLLAGALLVMAIGGPGLLSLPGLGGITARVSRLTRSWSPAARATGLGALTPLLPCGLLYAVYGAALLSGSWSSGALTMLGFALGSLPLLLLVQLPMHWMGRRLRPGRVLAVQRIVMVAAAGVLVWRGIAM